VHLPDFIKRTLNDSDSLILDIILLFVYTYIGYPLILWLLVQAKKRIFPVRNTQNPVYEPDVCLFVTAYNELDFVKQKVENSLQLKYPKEKVQYLWVTDGSDDGTDRLRGYPHNEVHHQPERKGKMHAMNRGMKFVKAPIIIFSDTNTLLNLQAIREIVACFSDPAIGCVAGEKRIIEHRADVAAVAGEGLVLEV
jgi:cellulose synthase/poly-beta-1,6-N-acetylglucosamine synthase-like glycosyltransferase